MATRTVLRTSSAISSQVPAAMFRLVGVDVKDLTREVAEDFHTMPASPTERETYQPRIDHLSEKAKAGLLVTFHWATAKLNGVTYRMNGQHSSAMVLSLGEVPPGLKVVIESYEVKDEAGLALLFRQFDDRKSSRTVLDISGAYQGLCEPIRGIPREVAQRGMQGITWYQKNVRKLPVPTGDDQYARFAVEEFHPFFLWVKEVYSTKTPELKKESIVGAMFATFEKNRVEAERFWYDVKRGGIDSEATTPPVLLDSWLVQEKENNKKRGTDLKPAEYYQGAIFAWNAFRQDTMISTIKWDIRKGYLEPLE